MAHKSQAEDGSQGYEIYPLALCGAFPTELPHGSNGGIDGHSVIKPRFRRKTRQSMRGCHKRETTRISDKARVDLICLLIAHS